MATSPFRISRHWSLLASPFLILSFHAQSGALFAGYSKTEQTSVVGDQEFDFDPDGQSLLLSVDLSDSLSLSLDYSSLSDQTAVTNRATGNLDIDSWSLSANYYLEDWSFSLSYGDWQDDLLIEFTNVAARRVEQNTDAPSISLSAGYDWTGENWQLGVTGGLHYSDWEQFNANIRPDATDQTAVDEGNSTFVSLSFSAARFVSITDEQSLIFGGSIGWNQLTSSESSVVSRNGRNISQINNPAVVNRLTGQNIIGTETFGQSSVFLLVELSSNWSVDVNVSSDFGSDDNSTAWSANLGYTF